MEILKNGDVVFKNVKALHPKLITTFKWNDTEGKDVKCDPFEDNAAYKINFELSKEELVEFDKLCMKIYKEAEKNDPKKRKWKEPMYMPYDDTKDPMEGKAKLKGAYSGEATRPPVQKDAQRNTLPADFELTTGSTINVWGKLYGYNYATARGVSYRLKGVQVLELADKKEAPDPFDTTDGFKASDIPETLAPADSNEIVADPTGGLLDGKDEQKKDEQQTSNDLDDEIPF